MIHIRFLPIPIIPPNLQIKEATVIWNSDTVWSTTLSNIIKIPDEAWPPLYPMLLTEYIVDLHGTKVKNY